MRAIITVIAVNIATILLVSMVSYHYWPEFPDGSAATTDDASTSLDTAPVISTAANATSTPARRAVTFGGYPCGEDCSQNAAGYRWATQHGISDPSNCYGRTAPFMEGCRVYAEERRARL